MKKLTPEQEREVVRRYAEGETGTALGLEFKVSPGLISILAKKFGRSPGHIGRCGSKGKLTDQRRQEIVARRQAKEQVTVLAEEFNVSLAAISNTVRKGSIAPNPPLLNADGPFVQSWLNAKRPMPPPNVCKDIPLSRLMAGR